MISAVKILFWLLEFNMRAWMIILLLVVTMVTGCSTHYLRVENGQAYLYLKAPHADSVMFASSLDRFQWRSAEKLDSRTWQVAIPKDIPQTYIYLVDNQIVVPDCRFREKDDFGSENCIYVPGM
jgi:hypothetical protein